MNFLQKLLGRPATPENHKLLRAIERAAQERTPEASAAVNRELLLSSLYLPIAAPIDGVKNRRPTTLKEKTEVRYLSIRNSAGETVVPVFTDEPTLRAWKPDAIWAAMPANQLFPVLLQGSVAQVVINLGAAAGGVLSRAELESLVTRTVANPAATGKISAGTRVEFKRPAKSLPPDVVERIKTILEGYPAITGAFLMQMSRDGSAPSRAFGLQMGQGAVPDSAMLKVLAECISPELNANEPLDFIPLNGSLLETIENAIPAIYKRG